MKCIVTGCLIISSLVVVMITSKNTSKSLYAVGDTKNKVQCKQFGSNPNDLTPD